MRHRVMGAWRWGGVGRGWRTSNRTQTVCQSGRRWWLRGVRWIGGTHRMAPDAVCGNRQLHALVA